MLTNNLRPNTKKTQADILTLDELDKHVGHAVTDLIALQQEPLIGGWEEKVVELLTTDGNKRTFFGVEMWTKTPVWRPNKNVSVLRPFALVRIQISTTMVNFFSERMGIDNEMIKALRPLTHPTGVYTSDDLRVCHATIAPDLSLKDFALELTDFSRSGLVEGQSVRQNLLIAMKQPSMKLVTNCLARVIVAVPHSCDIERLISAYNLLKSPDRSRMTSETANPYLHVMINMLVLTNFNVWPAVKIWMVEKERRTVSSGPQESSAWYTGVFDEANERKQEEENFVKVQF
ncbi:hypothetical protein BV898_15359 [Hypsibius exemplaris]|uniref:Uncharacterized protein n=1 Tax=Hypsibius exemplaris TaxID=2072580 RepID=A0A9X6RKC5_HYPEX|nr:hypothetical protein BV898_15359 [Hypsibius exemplaris]